MKKWLAVLFILMVMIGGCSHDKPAGQTDEKPQAEGSVPVQGKSNDQLEAGDEVTIVGQVASSGLVNGNTLWVQVQQPDQSFVIYHCQLKDNSIQKGEELKTLDIAKIKGSFLSFVDFETANASPLVTLYDCEIMN